MKHDKGSVRHTIKAIIYDKRGKILSIGFNNYTKTHPLQAHYASKAGEPYKQYLHAEIHAIILCRDLSKAYTIKVFRYGKLNTPLLAKPCPICLSAIEAAGIPNIEHT